MKSRGYMSVSKAPGPDYPPGGYSLVSQYSSEHSVNCSKVRGMKMIENKTIKTFLSIINYLSSGLKIPIIIGMNRTRLCWSRERWEATEPEKIIRNEKVLTGFVCDVVMY